MASHRSRIAFTPLVFLALPPLPMGHFIPTEEQAHYTLEGKTDYADLKGLRKGRQYGLRCREFILLVIMDYIKSSGPGIYLGSTARACTHAVLYYSVRFDYKTTLKKWPKYIRTNIALSLRFNAQIRTESINIFSQIRSLAISFLFFLPKKLYFQTPILNYDRYRTISRHLPNAGSPWI